MSRTAVVVLNYNGSGFLQQFLPAVIKHSGDAEIVVADNNSSDDSIAILKEHFSTVRVIELDENYGFTGGYNKALKQVEADYYVLLNSDVEVTPNWITPIISLMDKDAKIAACQPKIKSFHNKNLFEYAGAGGGMMDKWGYPFCRGRIFSTIEEDKGQYNDTIEVAWASGACMFVRAELYHEFNGLDDSFFAHQEEIDLCWRFQNANYKVMYCGDSEVYHVGGGTLNEESPFKTYLNFRNNISTVAKNYPSNGLFGVIVLRLLLDGVAGVQFIVTGKIKNCLSIIKAHFSFYSQISSLIKKRQSGVSSLPVTFYNKSVVWQYFAKGMKFYHELK